MTTKQVTKIEEIDDVTIRLTFEDGTTLKMAKKTYENGNWKNGTSAGLVKAVQG